MNGIFLPADILLPKSAAFDKWAVIACDQFTSEPQYWQQVRALTHGAPSVMQMIVAEALLESAPNDSAVKIRQTMDEYLSGDFFEKLSNAYVYVERTLNDGTVRCGIVGTVDLTQYSITDKSAAIKATEATVMERVPPRCAVRNNASIEFPHILLLCDDPAQTIIEPITAIADTLPLLYDFDLMQGGGHIKGWRIQGDICDKLQTSIQSYCETKADTAFAVGDGNHSLVAAKACYENDTSNSLARYALVELVNVRDAGVTFLPIHRVLTGVDVDKLIAQLSAISSERGTPITYFAQGKQGTFRIDDSQNLAVAVLQDFLDSWLKENMGSIDYIHGDDSLKALSKDHGSIGFLLPPLDKTRLFPMIKNGQLLPRKAFSLGHANEKRYYLEGRRIK